MKQYAESEERKIMDQLEEVVKSDGNETIDNQLSSSLHLFKNIKSSLKRCLSFSTSKALLDLHVVSLCFMISLVFQERLQVLY